MIPIVLLSAGHLRWKADYPPSQPVGSGFEPHWRPQPAKLPSFGRYSLETLPYLTYRFISELMDVYLMAGVHQQPDQSNYLAEGQT